MKTGLHWFLLAILSLSAYIGSMQGAIQPFIATERLLINELVRERIDSMQTILNSYVIKNRQEEFYVIRTRLQEIFGLLRQNVTDQKERVRQLKVLKEVFTRKSSNLEGAQKTRLQTLVDIIAEEQSRSMPKEPVRVPREQIRPVVPTTTGIVRPPAPTGASSKPPLPPRRLVVEHPSRVLTAKSFWQQQEREQRPVGGKIPATRVKQPVAPSAAAAATSTAPAITEKPTLPPRLRRDDIEKIVASIKNELYATAEKKSDALQESLIAINQWSPQSDIALKFDILSNLITFLQIFNFKPTKDENERIDLLKNIEFSLNEGLKSSFLIKKHFQEAIKNVENILQRLGTICTAEEEAMHNATQKDLNKINNYIKYASHLLLFRACNAYILIIDALHKRLQTLQPPN